MHALDMNDEFEKGRLTSPRHHAGNRVYELRLHHSPLLVPRLEVGIRKLGRHSHMFSSTCIKSNW